MVKFFQNIENFFQTYIEGFFDKKFSSGLQPVEIAKQIVRKMETERYVGVSYIYVPNSFAIQLNKDDYVKLQPYWRAISAEIAGYVKEQAAHHNYKLMGVPAIELCLDEALKPGKFRVESRFTEVPPVAEEKTADVILDESLSDTKEFCKFTSTTTLRPRLNGILTVIEGIDAGSAVDIGVNRINIGRREGNELALADMSTSRLHAYIVFEEGSHMVYDAKSLNGTYVNGHRITRKRLADGDRIKLGNTTILYEVK